MLTRSSMLFFSCNYLAFTTFVFYWFLTLKFTVNELCDIIIQKLSIMVRLALQFYSAIRDGYPKGFSYIQSENIFK